MVRIQGRVRAFLGPGRGGGVAWGGAGGGGEGWGERTLVLRVGGGGDEDPPRPSMTARMEVSRSSRPRMTTTIQGVTPVTGMVKARWICLAVASRGALCIMKPGPAR